MTDAMDYKKTLWEITETVNRKYELTGHILHRNRNCSGCADTIIGQIFAECFNAVFLDSMPRDLNTVHILNGFVERFFWNPVKIMAPPKLNKAIATVFDYMILLKQKADENPLNGQLEYFPYLRNLVLRSNIQKRRNPEIEDKGKIFLRGVKQQFDSIDDENERMRFSTLVSIVASRFLVSDEWGYFTKLSEDNAYILFWFFEKWSKTLTDDDLEKIVNFPSDLYASFCAVVSKDWQIQRSTLRTSSLAPYLPNLYVEIAIREKILDLGLDAMEEETAREILGV